MLADTAMTLGRSLLNIVVYETSNVTLLELDGLHVYDHSPTPVLKERRWENFEMVVLLTEAFRALSPMAKINAVGCGMPAMKESQPYWLSHG